MPAVRVYVPAGRVELDELATTGELSAGRGTPREAYAVTPALAEAGAGHDLEDLEYTAFCDAVDAAGRRRVAPGDRRVVVAADAEPQWVVARGGTPVSRVVLTAGVPLGRIASFHIDEDAHAGAAGGVGAAGAGAGAGPSGGLGGAGLGGAGLGGGATADEADDLLWYDVTEFDEVRGALG